jgi:hypothetical protein
MILVLCDEQDQSAYWVADTLRRHGQTVRMVTGADLASAIGWEHRVGQAGADCAIRFADGTRLRASDTRGVLNRLSSVPAAWLRRYGGPDREYAWQEMYAFYLSWLHALPGPVLNPPTPQGLCGNWRHMSAWTALAVEAGLAVRPFRQSSADDPAAAWQAQTTATHLYVVGSRVVGPGFLLKQHQAACMRLAKAAGTPLLGIDFAPDPAGAWQMTGASVLPDLIGGGEALAAALADALGDAGTEGLVT